MSVTYFSANFVMALFLRPRCLRSLNICTKDMQLSVSGACDGVFYAHIDNTVTGVLQPQIVRIFGLGLLCSTRRLNQMDVKE
jgi:hypothetical protein